MPADSDRAKSLWIMKFLDSWELGGTSTKESRQKEVKEDKKTKDQGNSEDTVQEQTNHNENLKPKRTYRYNSPNS